MRKFYLAFPFVSLVLFLYSQPAMCMGYGLYLTGNGGMTTWNGNMDFSHAGVSGGFGFVMDTSVARDKLFNFRLNLGLDIINSAYRSIDIYKFDVLCSFGFGLVRTEIMRFWIGPQIGLRINRGSGRVLARNRIFFEANIMGVYPSNAKYDASSTGVVGGLVMGFNFHITERLTVALDFGGRGCAGTGTITYDGYFRNYDKKEKAWGYEGFINFALIVRVNDSYLAQKQN
jgi:hypothetical protein